MLKVGDMVRYTQSGVCTIRDICPMDFGAEKQDYYILSPIHKQSSVVYIPCSNEKLVAKIVPVITREEAEAMLRKVCAESVEWDKDFRKRTERAKQALVSNNREEILLLIKSIYLHKKSLMQEGKRMHTADDYILKDAEILIFSEFSYVLGKEFEDVASYIKKELELE